MAQTTHIHAENGKQELLITREFELPLELLFTAFMEPEIFAEWMGTTVLKLENRKHGSWQCETRDKAGNVVLQTHGVFHDIIPNQSIIRTFEMENTGFPAQLEFLSFERLGDNHSKLTMQIIYKSAQDRDRMLQLPFAKGINMAHNRLQAIVGA